MPWDIFEDTPGTYCIYKLDAEGDKTGDALKCYPDKGDAQDYLDALYAEADDTPRKRVKGEVEYKASPILTQQVSGRTVDGIAAVMGNIDDGGDRFWNGAFVKTLQEGAGRIRHLWNHDSNQPPTAVIRDIKEIGKRELPADLLTHYPDATGALFVKREYLDTPRGSEVLAGVLAKAIGEMSVGYIPVRKDFEHVQNKTIRNLREAQLLDTSDVPWGMNPATRAVKGAIPFKQSPTAAVDASWDEAVEVKSADLDDLRLMAAWAADGDTKSAYRLVHHRADDGHSVVWRGVAATMAALTSGEANVPPEARRSVYDHLVKHFEQFGQEPPDFALVDFGYAVADARRMWAEAEGKVGRMISAANMAKLKAALDSLNQILLAAEPPSPEAMMDKALTVRGLFLEFEQAELDLAKLGVRHG